MISAILLAAGQSKRMNGENKLAKKIKGIPLIKCALNNILKSSIKWETIISLKTLTKKIIKKILKHYGWKLIKTNIKRPKQIKISVKSNRNDNKPAIALFIPSVNTLI
mgnify:CR=1 FL=1